MGATAGQFRFVSSRAIDASLRERFDVVRDPLSMAAWWSAVFLRVELLVPRGPDFAGLSVRLHRRGFLPHTFESASGVRLALLRFPDLALACACRLPRNNAITQA
ncbi:MAG: hypothetical protein KF723_23755 [Rhizobiaceae bacterium]|nr:hypothetical protein [Alphaproteobacteria bacterium]MBX3580229.1 hypothetical protein [Rhizobiaceae bacterium]MCW5740688.1 hypothetical protein [Alphaproteobacteria bacterium]